MDNKIEKIIPKTHCDTSDAGIMSKGSFLLTYISTSLFNLGLLLSLNFCSVVLYSLPFYNHIGKTKKNEAIISKIIK